MIAPAPISSGVTAPAIQITLATPPFPPASKSAVLVKKFINRIGRESNNASKVFKRAGT